MVNYRIRIGKMLLLFLLISEINLSFAQDIRTNSKEKKPFIERISIGGALGLSFGSNSTLVDVSPIVGYSLTDNFIIGLGFTYKYYQYNDFYQKVADISSYTDLKNNIYGGSIFARYFLTNIGVPFIENMFLHVEVEPLIYTSDFTSLPLSINGDYLGADGYYYNKEKDQITFTSYFLGGGLRQMITQRSYLYIEVLWNFNEELYSPYSNPRIRIGVAAGF